MTSSIFRPDLLAGRVALVTGGGTGIGASIAREYARLGATVVIASRKLETIQTAATGLSEELGTKVYGDTVDIRERDAVDGVIARTIQQHGSLDILVNNGGGQFFSPAEMIRPRGWDAVVSTNLTGTWNMTRAAHDAWMAEHGGAVVNITMLTRRGFPGMTHSVAARAGVEAMTRNLAIEWAPKDIRINAIQPGIIASSGIKNYPAGIQIFSQMQAAVPMKRLGRTEEIAWLAAYLASPAGEYITGQVWTVDGGKDLWGDYWTVPDREPMPPVVVPSEPWETD